MPIITKGDKYILKYKKKFIGMFDTLKEAKQIEVFVKELLKMIDLNDLHEAKVEAVFSVYKSEIGKSNLYDLMKKKINKLK